MTAQPRHARHHRINSVHAAAVLTVIGLFVAAVFLLVTSSANPGPVPTWSPGPVLTAPASPVPVVTVVPDEAVRHAEHRAHVDHLDRLHAWHLAHVRHRAHLERAT